VDQLVAGAGSPSDMETGREDRKQKDVLHNSTPGSFGPSSPMMAKSEPLPEAMILNYGRQSELRGSEYTWVQKLACFNQRYTTLPVFFKMIYRPLLLLRFPVVLW
jgi:hypothetical protein